MKLRPLLGEDRQTRVRRVAVAAILLSFLVLVRVAMLYRGMLRGQLLFWDDYDTFMDYFNCLPGVAGKNPYENNCMYPPLSELIFFVFSKVITHKKLSMPDPRLMRTDQLALLSLLLYLAIPITICIFAISDYIKSGKIQKRFVVIAFLLSTPFMYTIERGNVLIYSFAAVLVYMCYYNSDKKWLRELALIGLAVSAGIKLYPAIFGLLLVKDKRWKEAVRCMIYGVFFVFAPFLVFGGYRSFEVMLATLQSNSGGFGPTGFNCKLNFACIFDTFGVMWFGRNESYSWGQTVAYVLSALLIIAAFVTKKRWKSVLYLTLVMIGVPAFSFYYTGIFVLIPFLMYIAGEEKEMSWRELLYAPAFIAFLAPFPISIGELEKLSDINVNIQICSICILFMTIWGIIDALIDLIARIKSRGEAKVTAAAESDKETPTV